MALPVRKGYTGNGVQTQVTGGTVVVGATSFSVAAVTGWPATFPFYIVVNPGTSKEEKMSVTGISTLTLTVVRAQDNTLAVEHAIGAVAYPVFTADEADEANQIASAMISKGDLIATDGSNISRLPIGSNTHVLQADSTATNGFKWGQVDTASITDNAVTSAKIAPNTIVQGDVATALLKLVCPVGTISPYAGTAAPTGWLLCDGTSTTGYTELIGLVGSTTPNLVGRFLYGKTASGIGSTLLGAGGSLKISSANLPTHQHAIDHDHVSFNTTSSGSHSHTFVPAPNFNGNVAVDINSNVLGTTQPTSSSVDSGTSGSSHIHAIDVPSFSGNSGNGGFANDDYLQPFTAINYIIKHDY